MFTLPAAPRQDGSVRVLLVEDDELYADSIRCFLGYESRIDVVGYARDGHEALKLARSLRPDVVVMDLEMPRMDGFEATSRINGELCGVSVIILSSSNASEHIRRSRKIGAAAYVTKTSAHDELVPAILRARRPPMRRRPGDAFRDRRASWLRPPGFVEGGVDLAACLRGHPGHALQFLW